MELEKQNEGVQETALTAAEQGAAVRVETEGTAQETKRPRRRTPSRGRRIAAEAKTKETAAESSEDKGAAELMGISVNRTISMTFAIGSALAAVAGLLFICQYESLRPTLGALPGIKAFVAAVLGGIGSVPGAMLGGIILGIIESISKAYISTQLADAIVFSVLVIVLLVKPSGLLGKIRIEKV